MSDTYGPAVTFSALIPELHHYNERGLLRALADELEMAVSGPDMMAYIAAVAAHPAYTARFRSDLVQPGLRFPITADALLLTEAIHIGREVVLLQCFSERFADSGAGQPMGAPRLPDGERPIILKDGAIPTDPDRFPDRIQYDASTHRLIFGDGYIDNVPRPVCEYEVSGEQMLVQWFSYRRLDRSRPIIGDWRPPSPLEKIQADHWLPEYTTELMNVLHVVGRLVAIEPRQAELFDRIIDGPLRSTDDLRASRAFYGSGAERRGGADERQGSFLDLADA